METDEERLDLRGLKCPMPALLARRHLLRAKPGAIVLLITDDPMATIDVPHMCRQESFDVLGIQRDGDKACMRLRKP